MIRVFSVRSWQVLRSQISPSATRCSGPQAGSFSEGNNAKGVRFDIDGTIRKSYLERSSKIRTALRCPYPYLPSVFVSDPDPVPPIPDPGIPCEYVFGRACDSRRHLLSEHWQLKGGLSSHGRGICGSRHLGMLRLATTPEGVPAAVLTLDFFRNNASTGERFRVRSYYPQLSHQSRSRRASLSGTIIAMGIQQGLSATITNLSDQNYDQSFALYRLRFDIAQTHSEIPPNQIIDLIWDNRWSKELRPNHGKFVHPTALSALRFAGDAESDSILAPHSVDLRARLCARFLKDFFEDSMIHVEYQDGGSLGGGWGQFYCYTNFVAQFVNLGCVNESVIRDHILQSLTSHQKLYNHQADGLAILFKIAGATFEKYVDPSVIDRCFKLLEGHYKNDTVKGPLVQVRVVTRNEGL